MKIRASSFFAVLFLATLLMSTAACVVAIPVNETSTPETLGAGGVRGNLVYATAPAVGLVDNTYPPSSNTSASAVVSGYGLALGITDNLDLDGQVASGIGGNFRVGLKYQYEGKPYLASQGGDWSASFIARYLNAQGLNFDLQNVALRDLTAQGMEVAHSWGYRLGTVAAWYGGPKLNYGSIKGKRSINAAGTLSESSRTFSGFGGFTGLAFRIPIEKFSIDWVVEGTAMNMPATFDDSRAWYLGVGTSLGFTANFF